MCVKGAALRCADAAGEVGDEIGDGRNGLRGRATFPVERAFQSVDKRGADDDTIRLLCNRFRCRGVLHTEADRDGQMCVSLDPRDRHADAGRIGCRRAGNPCDRDIIDEP